MYINSWKSGKVSDLSVTNQNNLLDDNYTWFYQCNPVEGIEFLMHQQMLWEHRSQVPAMDLNDAEGHIFLEVKASDWWGNKQVR